MAYGVAKRSYETYRLFFNADGVSQMVLRFLIYAVAMGYRNAVPYQIPSRTERTVSAPRMRTASMAASSERK